MGSWFDGLVGWFGFLFCLFVAGGFVVFVMAS